MNTPQLRRPQTFFACVSALALTMLPIYGADAPATAPGTPAAPAAPVAPVAAPVPAVLAIPRPSAAEAAVVNAYYKKLLIQQDPAVAAIFQKYPNYELIPTPRNIAIIPSLTNPGFITKHNNYVEIARKGDIDVLFMGDSITDFWREANPATNHNGKAVFDKYYGNWKVANFGISGDSTQGVLYRLQNGEGQGFQPKVIMLMIGTNNAGTNNSAEIAEGVGAIVLEMRKDFPNAKILLLGIFPRGNPGDAIRKTVADVNPLIAKLDDGKNVFYLDIGSVFLAPDGTIPADIMIDRLHPTEKGYVLWAEAVKEPLAKLLQ